MGFSLPAAIAAQLKQPDHSVIAICGDGGFQMVVGELATAVQYRLPNVGSARDEVPRILFFSLLWCGHSASPIST
jgi:glyoxylate carboligase